MKIVIGNKQIPNLISITPDIKPVAQYLFNQFQGRYIDRLEVVRTECSDDYFNATVSEVQKAFNAYSADMNFLIRKGLDVDLNFFANIPHYFKFYDVSAIKLNTRLPAIIVGAGPSLDYNKHYLVKAKNRSIIIAVEVAVKPLVDIGVYPDIIVAVDPLKAIGKALSDIDLSESILVVGQDVFPEVLNSFNGKICFLQGSAPTSEWIKRYYSDKTIKTVTYGWSVSHTSFSIAKNLNCTAIVLIGQDLSYPSDITHASGCLVSSSASSFKQVLVPGYWPWSEVFTSNTFANCIEYFKDLTRKSDILVMNCTEGGASIEGAEPMKLSEAIFRYCKSEFKLEIIGKELILSNRKSELSKELRNISKKLKDLSWKTVKLEEYAFIISLFQRALMPAWVDAEKIQSDRYLTREVMRARTHNVYIDRLKVLAKQLVPVLEKTISDMR